MRAFNPLFYEKYHLETVVLVAERNISSSPAWTSGPYGRWRWCGGGDNGGGYFKPVVVDVRLDFEHCTRTTTTTECL